MPLATRWRTLDRGAADSAPNRYGVVEYGAEDGTVLAVESGMLKDEVKNGLAYQSAEKVRWTETQTRARAEELATEHRQRLDD